METGALVVGILLGILTIRALVVGGASVGGDALRRDEEPLIYWTIVIVSALAAGFLIWKGLAG